MHHKKNRSRKISRLVTTMALPLLGFVVLWVDGIWAFVNNHEFANSDSIIQTMTASMKNPAAAPKPIWQTSGKTLQSHYLTLNDQHRLSGLVSAIQNGTGATIPVGSLDVKLVQRSQVITSTQTNSLGEFTTDEIEPGTYTLCISGSEGFLAYGIHVIENELSDDNAQIEQNPFRDAPAAPLLEPANENDAESLGNTPQASSNKSSSFRMVVSRFGSTLSPPQGTQDITAAVIPPSHSTLQDILAGIPTENELEISAGSDRQINVEESVAAGGFQIMLSNDGKLSGRVTPLVSQSGQPIRLREMNVFLLKDDEIVNQVLTDPDGSFVFQDVEPDVYGFAAAGRDGFAAISFQAISASRDLESSETPSGNFRNASRRTRQTEGDVLEIAISPPEDIPFLQDEINRITRQPNPAIADRAAPAATVPGGLAPGGFAPGNFAPGNFSPSGFGSGGSFGFPAGRLVEAGLAAFLIAELFDEANDDFIAPPIPASPF